MFSAMLFVALLGRPMGLSNSCATTASASYACVFGDLDQQLQPAAQIFRLCCEKCVSTIFVYRMCNSKTNRNIHRIRTRQSKITSRNTPGSSLVGKVSPFNVWESLSSLNANWCLTSWKEEDNVTGTLQNSTSDRQHGFISVAGKNDDDVTK